MVGCSCWMLMIMLVGPDEIMDVLLALFGERSEMVERRVSAISITSSPSTRLAGCAL